MASSKPSFRCMSKKEVYGQISKLAPSTLVSLVDFCHLARATGKRVVAASQDARLAGTCSEIFVLDRVDEAEVAAREVKSGDVSA